MTLDCRIVHDLRMIEAAANMAPIHERPISQTDENWQALPRRLRGRGDFLLKRGRIKDAELMFDSATEIECLRSQSPSICGQVNSGIACDMPRVGDERVCPDCNPRAR